MDIEYPDTAQIEQVFKFVAYRHLLHAKHQTQKNEASNVAVFVVLSVCLMVECFRPIFLMNTKWKV